MLIKPAYSPAKFPQPTGWDDFACGDNLKHHTQQLLSDYGRRLRCGTTAGLGALASALEYQAFSLQAPVIVNPLAKTNGIKANIEHLPIKNGVVDQVIMPFVLEFSRDPHQVLREVNRILADDGYLVITGFNPLSPAILSGWLPANNKRFPWSGRYFSAFRIKDWLSLLGYEIVRQDYYIGHFLTRNDGGPSAAEAHSLWTEKLCRKVPQLSCGYAMLARKCVYNKTPKRKLLRSAAMGRRPVATARASTTFKRNQKEVPYD